MLASYVVTNSAALTRIAVNPLGVVHASASFCSCNHRSLAAALGVARSSAAQRPAAPCLSKWTIRRQDTASPQRLVDGGSLHVVCRGKISDDIALLFAHAD